MILAVLLSIVVAVHGQTYQEAQVLEDSQLAVDKYCSRELSDLDVDTAMDQLQVGAGDNFIYTAITAENPEDLASAVDPGAIVGKAFALVLSIVLFVFWLVCCWFVCCPCCMRICCKCCQNKRKMGEGKIFRCVLWTVYIGIAIAAIVLASLSLRGYDNIDEGFSGLFCSSAQLVQDSINGTAGSNDTAAFIGMLPAINRLEGIADALNPTSGFMTSVSAIVASTAKLDTAFTQVTQSLTQLEKIVSNAENQAPAGFMHDCTVCEPLAAAVVPVNSGLSNGIGAALKEARAQVEQQLQGQAAQDLREQLQAAMEPVREAKELILEQVGAIVDPSGFQKNAEVVQGPNSQLGPGIMAMFFFFMLVIIFGMCALGGFCYQHKPDSNPDKSDTAARCCICCVSCYSCVYAMIVLLVGGILVLVAMVGSGVCLVLVEFNQNMGENLLISLGTEVTEEMEMALNIADRCLSRLEYSVDPDGSRNLADIVSMDSATSPGTKVTVRESVFSTAVDPVRDQFDNLTSMLNTGDISLAGSQELATLTNLLAALDMKSLYLPNSAAVEGDDTYKDMNPGYLTVTLDCADRTLSTDLPSPLGGMNTTGMESMVTTGFSADGTAIDSLQSQTTALVWSCPTITSYTCDAGSSAMCEAGAKFIQDKKTPLVTQTKFKCVYQATPGSPSTVCNPRDMTNSSGTWTGVCVQGESTVEPFIERDCDIAELETNLKNIGLDLKQAFLYFDDTVSTTMSQISVDLFDTVDTFIIQPLETLLNQFDCSFMQSFFEGLTDALCLRAMNGFRMIANSYVWVGILSLIVALLLYTPWRLSRDNYDVSLREGADAPRAETL